MNNLTRVLRITYRNVRLTSTAIIQNVVYADLEESRTPLSDAMHIHIQPTRPCNFRGGQFVYLRFPHLGWNSIFQTHPFYVSWSYKDKQGGDIGVCIVEKKRGFTKQLALVDTVTGGSNKPVKVKVLIEGPYGKRLPVERHQNILLFATGIGIAGLTSVVGEVFQNRHQHQHRQAAGRITLFWELNTGRHIAWASDFWGELLTQDVDRKLRIEIYIKDDESRIQIPGARVQVHRKEMPVEQLIQSEMRSNKGSTLMCVCARDAICVRVRGAAADYPDRLLDLKELEFRPGTQKTSG
ncbi:hypothetical protein LTR10_024037 [Elasticomyces elasticus]|uniref:FAD-binding FR-type domain-containing protein n=1 Tax=Exophiala sideris TaxID=1016849 RepID=A0ABR0IUY8_9EURO|nr:hypothetical protein LTR10_024037 [Elasticomyces elasticus]KAK5049145.1 hypothetical protein LTR69_011172 [Exophiala sideris]